jgi:acyl CoA:acetate/3-ketoacid CoA transferase alpha subunit
MITGRKTIPATTATELEITGHRLLYIKPVTNDINIINSGDTNADNGYTLTANAEYIITMSESLYIYAASETVVQYMTI